MGEEVIRWALALWEQHPILGLVLIALVVFVLLQSFLMAFDRCRIIAYLEKQGDRVEWIRWAPFGTGWMGSLGTRIYKVGYLDGLGILHVEYCRTGPYAGVYFTDLQS